MPTGLSLLSMIVLAACIDPARRAADVTAEDAADTRTSPDATAPDLGPDLVPDVESAACDFVGFSAEDTRFFSASENVVASIVSSDEGGNVLRIRFWAGSTLAVGTYELGMSAQERDYDTCTVCVHAERAGSVDTAFFATSGTLVIDGFDTTSLSVIGSLSDATMVEISVDADHFGEPIEGGRRWCIDSLGFEALARSIR